jgi:hypothetical protein
MVGGKWGKLQLEEDMKAAHPAVALIWYSELIMVN